MNQIVRRAAWPVAAAVIIMGLAVAAYKTTRSWTHLRAAHWGQGGNFGKADLEGADLVRANLKKANLRSARMSRSRCFDADLRGADLREADLRWTMLAGADLRWALLDCTRLQGAVYDKTTRWPKGFQPQKHGALLGRWDARVWSAFGRPPQ